GSPPPRSLSRGRRSRCRSSPARRSREPHARRRLSSANCSRELARGGAVDLAPRVAVVNRRDGGWWWRLPLVAILWLAMATPILGAGGGGGTVGGGGAPPPQGRA